MKLVSINVARFDATKHHAISVVGDARVSLEALDRVLGDYRSPAGWLAPDRNGKTQHESAGPTHSCPGSAVDPAPAFVVVPVAPGDLRGEVADSRSQRRCGKSGDDPASPGAGVGGECVDRDSGREDKRKHGLGGLRGLGGQEAAVKG